MRAPLLASAVRLLLVLASTNLAVAFAHAADALKFSDIVGWWEAEPSYAGESSRVLLHFVEDSGAVQGRETDAKSGKRGSIKQSVRLSLLGIGGYDVPIGTVSIAGDSLDMQPYPFPLRYDAARGTLSGYLPEAAVPVYRIPVEFRRIEPPPKPEPPVWNAPRPAVKWTIDVKAPVWAGLAHDESTNLIFVGDDAGVLHAIDVAGDRAGRVRWTFETGKPIKARPEALGDAIYVASDSGFLYRLDKRTGAELWRAKIDTGSPERIPASQEKSRWDRYGSSVAADDQSVYVASRDKHLYSIDIATGRERWRVATNDIMTATPALYRDLVLFASFDGKVQAVTARDGKPRWTYDAKLPVAGDLVVDGDRVFVGSRTYDLVALDTANGRELWKHYYWFSWIESPPVVRDGVVYTGSSDGIGVYAIDAGDGSRRWKARVPGWAWPRPAVQDNLIVAATVGVGKYPGPRAGSVVGLDRASGAVQWIYLDPPSEDVVGKKTEWGFGSSPLVVDGMVYAADLSGRVLALQP